MLRAMLCLNMLAWVGYDWVGVTVCLGMLLPTIKNRTHEWPCTRIANLPY